MKTLPATDVTQTHFLEGMSITAKLKEEYIGCTHPSADNYNQLPGGGLCEGGICLGGNQADYCQILALSFPENYSIDPNDDDQALELPISLTNSQGLEIEGLQFVLKYDVRELDTEYVDKKLATISQYVIPQDAGGVLDRNKLIGMVTKAISPDIAEELIIDQATASQKMYTDVKTDIGLMMLGNEANYVENDPAAKTKMQYAQDIVSRNPKAQSALQGDEVFQQLFENYSKNLQMSIMQEENKTVGRIGVSQLT